MAISLYDASVTCYLQTLAAVSGFLEKGLAHCRDNGIDPAEIVETRIVADMRPFRFQIHSVVFHSAGAIEAIRSGVLRLPGERPAHDYAALQALVVEAHDSLAKLTPEDINPREGAEVVFEVRDTKRLFTAEGFLLSFSLPNFHFHATTAYDILRAKGVPLGKRDYMGALRLKN
ncbi:MAG: DUF1993 domain-containing protein [Alphaproteobacteria bacterium]|nr:DUF1993 domain-containing protein [Alphaproteobacteria bacterium]MDE1986958.1 DUF1993 domain-containing protein [Alphaproteobacteria bacterium]MDE2162962.1 DUF1993 domain-containing protein [Alphaproteobacteria bacterium]MDE2265477.1 DUF1993 domain-containing protein [Alphaproteobacteria bacterium]MDE2500379.1 DUF1993 domain-containing protein [Alphaproteobacteria bacterium]